MKAFFKKHVHELTAGGIVLLWLLVCLASRMVDETNDDTTIAFMIAQSPEHYCLFVHPAYSKLLGFVFEWIPSINWWSVFSVAGITTAAYVFSIMLLRRFSGYKKWIAVVAMLLLIYAAAIYRFNFTRTAGIISLAGAVLSVECICGRTEWMYSRILTGIGAVILLLWGSSIRGNCYYLSIPFCLGYFVSKLFFQRSILEQICSDWKRWLKRGGILALILFSVFVYVQIGDYWLRSDPAWDEYIRYMKANTIILDYNGLPAYEDNEEVYRAIGISELDLDMVKRWTTENTDSYTTEKAIALSALSDVQISWRVAAGTVFYMAVIYSRFVFPIVVLIAFVCMVFGDRKDMLYIICMSVGAMVIALYFSKLGRIPIRVFEVICMNAAITIFLGCRFGGNALSQEWNRWISRQTVVGNRELLGRTAGLLTLALASMYVVYGFFNSGSYWQYENSHTRRAERIEAQNDRVYVVSLSAPLMDDVSAYGLWHMPKNGLSKNMFYLGGWSQRAPYKLELREQQRVRNPFTALVENPAVYSTDYERVHHWLSEYYQDHITMSTVDEMDGKDIVQYSRTIEAADMTDMDKEYNLFASDAEDQEHLYVRIDADTTDFEQYHDVRLNLYTTEGLRTFRLQKNENGFSAKLHGSYEIDGGDSCLIALGQNGVYEKVGDLKVYLNE